MWVGYYKHDSGQPTLTWSESVDEALSYGWIDGIRKNIDDTRYMIRFTPRKPGSIWSTANTKKAMDLIERGLMQPAGLQAFQIRNENRTGVYSHEQRAVELDEPYNLRLKANPVAWDFFQAQAPSYRKAVNWWILNAKQEETRLKRLEKLIAYSVKGQTLPEFTSR